MNMLDVQVQEMKSMSAAIHRLEGKKMLLSHQNHISFYVLHMHGC